MLEDIDIHLMRIYTIRSFDIHIGLDLSMYSYDARITKLTSTATRWKICDANMYNMPAANVIRRYDAVAGWRLLFGFLRDGPYKAAPASPLSSVVNIRFIR